MKIATWNINSIRARVTIVLDWLQRTQPDVLGLQETKVVDEAFPADALAEAGYASVFVGGRTYNGVALVSREAASDVRIEYPLPENPEPRLISAVYRGIRVYCAYFPNGRSPESEQRDVYDPAAMDGRVLYHPAERAALERVRQLGLVDAFRVKRSEPGLYSWWDYRQGAFRRNMGLRIDHIWATPDLADRVVDAYIDAEERRKPTPSDHAPVVVEFEI